MTPRIDLDAYFARLRYAGPRTPALETLRALHLLHPQAIPFENLDAVLGRPVRLDAASLEQKLLRGGRGGWCFEHNLLFSHVLRALGFPVTWLGARVVYNMPEGTVTARTHMLLLVDVEGVPHVADVGFGGLTLTGPLRLEPGVEQATPHEPFRLVASGGGFVMEAMAGGAWRPLYRFDLHEQQLPDYELANWYLLNYPESHFLRMVVAARVEGDHRYSLRGTELTVHRRGAPSERTALATAAELRAALEGVFQVRVPEGPDVEATLRRLVTPAAPASSAAAAG